MSNTEARSNTGNPENPSFTEKINTLLEHWEKTKSIESLTNDVVKEKTEKIRQAFQVISTEISELEKIQPQAEELELVYSIMDCPECPPCPKVQPNEEIIEKLREIINRPENAAMMSAKMDTAVNSVVKAGPPECEELFQRMQQIMAVLNGVTF